LSFFLGDKLEAADQKVIKIGIAVRVAKNSHVFKPPPILLENQYGTTARRLNSKMFEN
jgi:hypothetical protein